MEDRNLTETLEEVCHNTELEYTAVYERLLDMFIKRYGAVNGVKYLSHII